MALREFNYPVQTGLSEQVKANINNIQFDDGYSQRTKKGIHNRLRQFSVTYVGSYFNKNGEITTDNETKEVLDFLNYHEGYKAFLWTSFVSPYSTPVKVFCDNWTITYSNCILKISMKFQEVLA